MTSTITDAANTEFMMLTVKPLQYITSLERNLSEGDNLVGTLLDDLLGAAQAQASMRYLAGYLAPFVLVERDEPCGVFHEMHVFMPYHAERLYVAFQVFKDLIASCALPESAKDDYEVHHGSGLLAALHDEGINYGDIYRRSMYYWQIDRGIGVAQDYAGYPFELETTTTWEQLKNFDDALHELRVARAKRIR